MTNCYRNNIQKGQAALLIILVSLIVITVAGLGLADLVVEELGMSIDVKKSAQAFYAADAGIEYAIWERENGDPANLSNFECGTGIISIGEANVCFDMSNGLKSIGERNGIKRAIVVERTLIVHSNEDYDFSAWGFSNMSEEAFDISVNSNNDNILVASSHTFGTACGWGFPHFLGGNNFLLLEYGNDDLGLGPLKTLYYNVLCENMNMGVGDASEEDVGSLNSVANDGSNNIIFSSFVCRLAGLAPVGCFIFKLDSDFDNFNGSDKYSVGVQKTVNWPTSYPGSAGFSPCQVGVDINDDSIIGASEDHLEKFDDNLNSLWQINEPENINALWIDMVGNIIEGLGITNGVYWRRIKKRDFGGNELWAVNFCNTNLCKVKSITTDNLNNDVIATGSGTKKYDSGNGDLIWESSFSGLSVAVDSIGNVVLAGGSVIKLDPDGGEMCRHNFNGGVAKSVAIDSNDYIIVAGLDKDETEPDIDVRTIKYYPDCTGYIFSESR